MPHPADARGVGRGASGLDASIDKLPGVGPASSAKLARLGILLLRDILFHLPLRYQDRTRISPIGSLMPGVETLIEGQILHAETAQRRRRVLFAVLHDGTGSVTLRFFHFDERLKQSLKAGARIACFGEPRRGVSGLELVHPQLRALATDAPPAVNEHLTPVYPSTEGLSQITLRRLAERALHLLENDENLPDWLPKSLRDTYPDLRQALRILHAPLPTEDVTALSLGTHPAQRRLAFEELIAHHLSLLRLRRGLKQASAPALKPQGKLFAALLAQLPFSLTNAQRRVIVEIESDLARPHPMLRLVQGDVGSGKTLVAAAACLHAIESGYQAALMAPTELLAEQHHRSLSAWLTPLGIEVAWLSGNSSAAVRRREQRHVASGQAALAIGTHALLQGSVDFKNLALSVIDEQHRFGVHQRLMLQGKTTDGGLKPHQLIMTATPIPRTLAMTAYAGLDHSVIDELPPGRTPIKTIALSEARRDEVVERVRAACRQGQQAYWVCTLIEESEVLECQTAEDTARTLAEALPELRLGLVHGRVKSEQRADIMAQFRAGHLDVLVATTVIEVGVDVPKATLMIIENAERLGLAQLHQLRGRVGRGTAPGYCVLLYRPPLGGIARQRLDALRHTSDGFEIARIDLKLRGAGEILGTKQSGELNLRIADLLRDQDLLPQAQATARTLLIEHPQVVEPLIERWTGSGLRYARA